MESARVAGERFRSSRLVALKIAGEGIGAVRLFIYLHTSRSGSSAARKAGKGLGGHLQPAFCLEKGPGKDLASYLETEMGLRASGAAKYTSS